MATKDKKPAVKKAASSTKTTVTRIVASDTKKPAAKAEVAAETTKTTAKKTSTPAQAVTKKSTAKPAADDGAKKNIFAAIGGYFAGAWYELKQVSWPNRKATWSLTAAMLAFTGFFIILILLLDTLFKYLFELILV